MKKIFTFLVAFLATLSGAVWGQEYGSPSNPLDLNGRSESLPITDDEQEWYITSTSETNNVGIIIQGPSGSGDVIYPRIHLINVQAIDVTGTAIEIHDRAQPTLILEGENKIYSDDGPAIYVQNLPNTKLNIEGTGSLEIIMTHSDNVAIGNSSGGADRPADCGGITVNSGTVVTNGVIGSMCTYDFTVNNNAVFIVNNLDKSAGIGDLKLNGGIWGENPDGIGYIQGDERILDSPLPDGYKINLESGKKLTIGDDQILNEDQLIDNGGQAKGYKVVYSSPKDVPMNVSGELPSIKYVGSKYTVEQWNPTATVKEENTTYEHIATHWLKDETTWVSANTEVAETPATQYTTLSEMETKEYQAVWYLKQKSVAYSLTTGFTGTFNLWYPEVAHLFDATEQTGGELKTLAQVGLKRDNESGYTVGAGSPITDEGTFTSKLNLASSTTNAPTGLVTDLIVSTDASELDLGKEDEVTITFNGGDFTYNGEEQKGIETIVSVVSKNNPDLKPTYGKHYLLKFSKDGKEATFQDADDYTVTVVAIEDNGLLIGQKELAEKVTIKPRPMNVYINEITAEDLDKKNVADIGATYEKFDANTNRGLVENQDQDAGLSGDMTITLKEGTSNMYTVTFSNLKLENSGGENPNFLASNYTPTFMYGDTELKDGAGTIDITIDDITPGEDTDIDDGDDDDSNWEWNTDANAYVIIYDGKGHGVATITVNGDIVQPTAVIYKDAADVELLNDGLPTNAGRYTAEVEVTVGGESKTKIFPLLIKERPLAICFDLSGLSEEYTGYPLDASEFVDYREVPGKAISGLVDGQTPGKLEGTITIASEPNANGKYAVTFKNIAPVENGTFTPLNYEEHYYLDGVEIDLSTGGNTVGDGDDDFPGIEIDDNTSSGGSGIGTKRYRLYLANKDYNVADAKTDYADEGLELFSRHDKKYTKAGGSFTVWYEKDGVANAGGYRIFWSNKANGDYKEVKFDSVSEYFQIRNVQSNVYVKIYAADGFPVGNEEISAADYRAYAQPNKIVVITPQPTDVQIISMAGAVVATDKVTGQREFANLAEGVYIVRMGETVVKLQVRK